MKIGRYRLLGMALALCLLLTTAFVALGEGSLGVVHGGKLHLREAPSLDAAVLATYESGAHVQILASQNGWYQVETGDGRTGYMDARFVSPARIGVIENQGRFVNLRSNPSREAAIVGQYPSGTQLTVLSDSGYGWLYVDIGGVQGYVDGSFIKDAAPEATAAPVATPNLEEETNPFALPLDGDDSVVQQVGTHESEVYADEALSYTIYYPQLGIPAADDALQGWVDNTIQDAKETAAEATAGTQVEVTVQYDAYLVSDRYIGVLETGFISSQMFAHPGDLIFAINADRETGALLTYQDIFGPSGVEGAVSLLRQKLAQLPDALDETTLVDESWLTDSLITGEGIAVVLARGEYLPAVWGTQSVLLPYAELSQAGLLALPLSAVPVLQTEGTPAPAATQPPQAQGQTIDPSRPMIALTFDDGPSDYTLKILGLLAQHGGRATFCMVGNRIANYRDVVAQVAAQGSEIATHTWSHKNLTNISHAEIESQLKRSMEAITAVTGQPVTVLRPPYGAVNKEVRDICKRLGLTIATWSIDTEDWKTKNAGKTHDAILHHVKNGSIILCHDVKSSTADAMERVIPELVAQGYQLVTVTELLHFSQTGGEAGVVYSHLDTSHLPVAH